MTNARILLLVSDRVVRSVIGRTAQAIHTILAAVGMKHNTFFRGRRFLMVAKYDIFKKINESIVWVEAVEISLQ